MHLIFQNFVASVFHLCFVSRVNFFLSAIFLGDLFHPSVLIPTWEAIKMWVEVTILDRTVLESQNMLVHVPLVFHPLLDGPLWDIIAQMSNLVQVGSSLPSSIFYIYIYIYIFFYIICFYIVYSENVMAPHSSVLAWRIPWMEEPGKLQSMGSLGVGHDWATSLSFFTFMHWRRKWQPTPVFLPGESQGQWSLMGRRLWGRTESDTTEAT